MQRTVAMAETRVPGARERRLPLQVNAVEFHRNGRKLLTGLDFRLEPGKISVLLGPNGAGKSLLLRLLMGLIVPDAGWIRWNGVSPTRCRHQLGMVLQKPVMLRRSALANVEFALARAGVAASQRRRIAQAALEQAGLLALGKQPAARLSGGEAQRLAIVRAWAQKPRVLLLDEPCANLDPHSTARVEALIRDIHAGGTRVILSTHDLGQARRLADEVLFLADGQLHEHASAEGFFRNPDSGKARAFLRGDLVI